MLNNKTVVSTGYKPRPMQEVLHRELRRFSVLNMHRRFGKTIFADNTILHKGLACPLRNPQYGYLSPTYSQAEITAWKPLKEYAKNIPGVKFREQKLTCTFPRPQMNDVVTIHMLGAENPDRLRGIYLDGCVLDEYASMNPTVWETIIRPALADREGWALFIGTPAGQNHFYDISMTAQRLMQEGDPEWMYISINAEESNVIPEKELESSRRVMTKDKYEQEYMCSFTAALTGAYYSELITNAETEGRIVDLPHDPAHAVSTFWDLGISDNMAIWFVQKVGEWYHVIDYLECAGKGIEYYIQELGKLPYTYAKHYMPHDIKQRELSTGKERYITFETLGLRPMEIVPRVRVKADGIHACRMVLPKCKFNKTRTRSGLIALRNYQRIYDDKLKAFKDNPKHDWTSHAADAFQTFALGVDNEYSFSTMYDRDASAAEKVITNYDEFNL